MRYCKVMYSEIQQKPSQFMVLKLAIQRMRNPDGLTIPHLITFNLYKNLTGSLSRIFIFPSGSPNFILSQGSFAFH